MKYSFVAILFAAAAYAKDASTTASSAADSTITAAPTHSPTAQEICLAKCSGDDRDCKAKCGSVPFVASAQVVGLDQCVSKECIPKQTIAANNYQAYGDCRQSCIAKYYYNAKNTDGVPDVINTAGGAAATGTGSSGSNGSGSNGSGSNGSGSSSGNSTESGSSGTATGTGAKASSTGAGNKLAFSMAGLVGAIGVAVLAL